MVWEVVEDFDAAVERFRTARAEDDRRLMRRALRESLGHLYTLQQHRRGRPLGPARYHALQDGCAIGLTTGWLVTLRGVLVHQVTRIANAVGEPDPDIYYDTYGTVTWLTRSDIAHAPKELTAEYDQHMANRDVFQTLAEARTFLVDPGVLGPLVE